MDFLIIYAFPIIIILILFVHYSMRKANNSIIEKINGTQFAQIPKFYSTIKFDTKNDPIVIENPYECTTKQIKKCKISDKRSCFGCQNLTSKCKHFENDVMVIETDGTKNILSANLPNEGYCLSADNLEQECNKHHGDLVILHLTSGLSTLICNCKNPGYIGNVDILGACDTPFLCNGKVKTINTDLEKIKCVCENGFMQQLQENTPSCVENTVNNTTNFDLLSINYPVNKKVYDKTIAGNFNGTNFTNPCSICPITGSFVNGNLIETKNGYQCATNSTIRGVPIRRNLYQRVLAGDEGPDAILDLEITEILVFGKTNNSNYISGIIVCKPENNLKFYKAMNLDQTKAIGIQLTDHQISFPGNFYKTNVTSAPHINCFSVWPKYFCKLLQDDTESPKNTHIIINNDHSLKFYSSKPISAFFLFKTKDWDDSEDMNNLISFDYGEELIKYRPTSKLYEENQSQKNLMGLFLRFKFNHNDGTIAATLATTKSTELWHKFKNAIIFK